ncbi:MAG: hypothetical protein EA422_07015 [Gemmatimonadales bacterium]|nr:MAG: hypothetical protein EA422_07015 [Gemmatimonadales bacterium]
MDLHSHLVPGVDDGASTVENVLEGIGRMVEHGVDTVVTTPHLEGSLTLLPEAFQRRLETMEASFAEARTAVMEAFPDLVFLRANEVALDHPEPDLSDPRIQLGDGGYLLVEFPRLRVPPGSAAVLKRLVDEGNRMLLAHPERYRLGEGERALRQITRWRETGVPFQVNYGSLVGAYGPEPRRRALWLLRKGWVECLATDFHGRPNLRLYIRDARRQLIPEEVGAEPEPAFWQLLTSTNPRRILGGEEPLPVPPVEIQDGIWQRFTSFFR